jgi:DNA-binding MarR family transcriptional regulator
MIEKAELQPVFTWICQYITENSYPPTLRELANQFYMSPGRIDRMLTRMEIHGWIAREPGRKRGITLLRSCPGVRAGKQG